MQLGYNSRNQLTSASLRGVSASFGYDAEGVRQTMTTGSGGTSTTTYYTSTPHGPLSQVVARYEKSSVNNGGAPMFFDGGGIHWAVYGHGLLYEVVETINGSGKPVESEVLYYHTDQVGSTVAVTNQARQDVLWVQYDAYGAVTEAVSPTQRDGKPAARPGLNQVADKLQRALSVTPYLYCGEHGVMTDRTGLIHMRARYYHPGLRRFVNPDPIGFAGGMNWYGYAGGGPVMAVDPSGLVSDGFLFTNPDMDKYTKITGSGYFLDPFGSIHSTVAGRRTGQVYENERYYERRWPNNLSYVKTSYVNIIDNLIERNKGLPSVGVSTFPSFAVNVAGEAMDKPTRRPGKNSEIISFGQGAFGDEVESWASQKMYLGDHWYDIYSASLRYHEYMKLGGKLITCGVPPYLQAITRVTTWTKELVKC